MADKTATTTLPIRTCIGTGIKKPKSQMIRLVRLLDPTTKAVIVKIDPKGKERGRGANLDTTVEAFDLAIKKGAIERALKLDKKLTSEEIADLRTEFVDLVEEKEFRQGQRKVTIKVSKAELQEKLGKDKI